MASVGTITIPVKLRTATARVLISSTSCSVTCGMGYKVEETCQIGPKSERRYCDIKKVECLTNWICGMLHFTILVGKPFEFQCLSPAEIGPEIQSFSYSWRLARGIITTDDALFKPFKTTGFVIKLSPAKEYDAGTYRCDVQFMRTYKIVKRIYFGLRVIPGHLVDLNFDKSLTLEQHLESENEKNQQNATSVPVQKQQQSWRQRALFVFLIGIGSGAVGGILLHNIFYYLVKVPNNSGYIEE
ncbi:transmembrane protein 81 [Candoia aspera]|uniref:transmembrane protein 81 n=1 Tax=Candoia aspera TaxID=51853 RepID=UPI002FD7FB8E